METGSDSGSQRGARGREILLVESEHAKVILQPRQICRRYLPAADHSFDTTALNLGIFGDTAEIYGQASRHITVIGRTSYGKRCVELSLFST